MPREITVADPDASFFAPVKGSLFGIISLGVIGAVSSVVPFIAIVELARTILPALNGGVIDAGRVWTIVVIAVIALFVSVGAAFLSGLVSHFADAKLQFTLRRRIIAQLQRLPLGWFNRRSSGAVRQLVENDVGALHQLVAHAIQDTITAILVPLVSLAYLFWVQWQIAVAAMVPLVVAVIVYTVMTRSGSEKFHLYDEAAARLAGATVEFVHAIQVVKRFGQVGRSHRRFRDETDQYVRFVGDWTDESAKHFTIVEIVSSPVVVLVWLLAIGTWLVSAGSVQAIDVLPGLLLGLGLTGPLMKVGASGQLLRNAMNSQRTLATFFSLRPIAEPQQSVSPAGTDVDFDEVTFSYDGQHPVLQEIIAHCAPRPVTALVGASGSGKSTLAKLVPRFYDVESGSTSIGQADVRTISQSELYRSVGFVFPVVLLISHDEDLLALAAVAELTLRALD